APSCQARLYQSGKGIHRFRNGLGWQPVAEVNFGRRRNSESLPRICNTCITGWVRRVGSPGSGGLETRPTFITILSFRRFQCCFSGARVSLVCRRSRCSFVVGNRSDVRAAFQPVSFSQNEPALMLLFAELKAVAPNRMPAPQ